ncbi:MAG: T9SS type A sorting domain-containing protein [Bacteroidetes bacterium]|nr:T9SS type A sorting domain-containing protein [Bacteroidota bacterium]
MKTNLLFISALIALFTGSTAVFAQSASPILDSVFMGPGYAKEVYYSMSNGTQGTIDRKQWDIAFRTSRRSASILTNDAANNNALGITGVELYSYPKSDTSGWASFDTTGFSTWKNMVNSTTDWETGAFDQYQLGHPDYGWGKYNTATHDVVGDSLFLIKLRDGSFRKIWIIRKYSSLNKYEFRYANLDGSAENTILLDCSPYESKNFVGYSLTTNAIVDYEPVATAAWDILFTKYMYTYPDGTQYPVTGVLSNYGIKVNKFEHVAPDFTSYNVAAMDSTRSPIGWDWKYYNSNAGVYNVVDSVVYFVLDGPGNIYKLVFKEFAGSSTGKVILEKELIQPSGINDLNASPFTLAVYPNPASTEATLLINTGNASEMSIVLSDLSGRQIWVKKEETNTDGLNSLRIPVTDLMDGFYLLTVNSAHMKSSTRLIVKH